MKGLKAAAFVQLNDQHNVMSHHHLQRNGLNFHLSHRHQSNVLTRDATASMSSTQIQRRRRQSQLQSTSDDNINNGDEENDTSNGIFLDLDTYLQAEETLLRPDGSLRDNNNINGPNEIKRNEAYQSVVMQGLFPPTYSYPNTKQEQDLSDEELLLQSVTDIQNDKSTLTQQQQLSDAEALHQQVFAEEQVYLEQSEEFRKSLSSNLHSSDENYESPMAKGRREAVEEYNQGILSDLLREIEEMEATAISRDEALSRASNGGSVMDEVEDAKFITDEGTSSTGRPAFCSQCGLPVTPDLVQRASYGTQKLLCHACYGAQFRLKDEAKVRLASGPNIWEANQMSSEKKKRSQMSRRRRFDKSKMNRIDTSSLFRIPDSRMPNEQIINDVNDKRTPTTEDPASESLSSRGEISSPTGNKKTTKPAGTLDAKKTITSSGGTPAPSTSNAKSSVERRRKPTAPRLLGGRELEKRKTQRQSAAEDETDTNLLDKHTPQVNKLRQQEVGAKRIEAEASPETYSSENWVKVEDSTTKRIMYWNKETGEMKRSID